jgi:CRP-like cAMP-binding protein
MKIENTSPWLNGEREDWSEFVRGRAALSYKKNAAIFNEGDESECIYIVEEGRVRVTFYHPGGMEKQLYIAGRGSMFGESACLGRRLRADNAIAIVDSKVFRIPRDEAARLMRENWPLTERVIQTICRKEALLQKQVVDLSFADSTQRIAQVLLNLCEEYGERTSAGIRIAIQFTQQDVANMAKTSRVTISNTFQFLYDLGILARKNKRFYLNRLDLLRRISTSSIPAGEDEGTDA